MKTRKGFVVGKSYDWHSRLGLAITNKRGVTKRSMVERGRRPARWVSKYGSISFNQYGREFPLGGMNERGLVVEILWLAGAQYGKPEANESCVNELQFVQYLLDRSATVEHALAAAKRLRIVSTYAKVHYFVCDAHQRCATLEHVNGKLVAHHGANLRHAAITNSTYGHSEGQLQSYKPFGGERPLNRDTSSLSRFSRIAAKLDQMGGQTTAGAPLVSQAFASLRDVGISNYSKWNIVYEPQARVIHFRHVPVARDAGNKARSPKETGAGLQTLTLRLAKTDFSCSKPVHVLDLVGNVEASARWRFVPYRPDMNERLIRESFHQLRAPIPAAAIRGLAAYPKSTRCSGAPRLD